MLDEARLRSLSASLASAANGQLDFHRGSHWAWRKSKSRYPEVVGGLFVFVILPIIQPLRSIKQAHFFHCVTFINHTDWQNNRCLIRQFSIFKPINFPLYFCFSGNRRPFGVQHRLLSALGPEPDCERSRRTAGLRARARMSEYGLIYHFPGCFLVVMTTEEIC